jgi:hypothetical protein
MLKGRGRRGLGMVLVEQDREGSELDNVERVESESREEEEIQRSRSRGWRGGLERSGRHISTAI